MRKISFTGLALLAVGVAALIWFVPDRLVRQTSPVVSHLPLPPSRAPPPEPPPLTEPVPATPPTPQLPPLPTREVAQIPFHAVPENEEPPKPQPFQMRDSPGLVATRPGSRAGAQSTAVVAPPPRQVAGKAEAAGAANVLVAGRPLQLFGIRPPAGNDHCGASGGGAAVPCAERARAVLAARLARNASCRFPAPSSDSIAICLDGDGVDLGGLLVAEGLALADRSQSFDYVGAESIAQAQKRGLWQFR